MEHYMKTNTKRTKALFKKAWNCNWDNGLEELFAIIRDEDCDRATAVMIYWNGSPGYFTGKTREEIEACHLGNYELLREIEENLLKDKYERVISYNPEDLVRQENAEGIPAGLSGEIKGTVSYKDILWPNQNAFQDEIFEICSNCDSVDQFYSLEENGADFNKKILNGYSYPIEVAANYGQIEALKYFVEKGFSLDRKYNKSPLLFNALRAKNLDLVRFLIENKAKVNNRGEFKRTCLHYIASLKDHNGGFDDGMRAIALYLIEQGADTAALDSDKKSPLDLAEMWENSPYRDFLTGLAKE